MSNWYAIEAFNQITIYGFGTVDEAEAYVDLVNGEARDNLKSFRLLSDEEIADRQLDTSDLGFNLADELRAREDGPLVVERSEDPRVTAAVKRFVAAQRGRREAMMRLVLVYPDRWREEMQAETDELKAANLHLLETSAAVEAERGNIIGAARFRSTAAEMAAAGTVMDTRPGA